MQLEQIKEKDIKKRGNVQQSTSFKKHSKLGVTGSSPVRHAIFYNNMAVAQLDRALKINNKRFLKNREYGTTAQATVDYGSIP